MVTDAIDYVMDNNGTMSTHESNILVGQFICHLHIIKISNIRDQFLIEKEFILLQASPDHWNYLTFRLPAYEIPKASVFPKFSQTFGYQN